MAHLLKDVHKTLTEKGLFPEGSRILLAVSGGIDSVALFHIFRHLCHLQKIEIRVAHFNHSLRGKEADEDARFVQQLCRQYNVPFSLEKENIPAIHRENRGKSLEEVARERRFHFFWKVMKTNTCHYLALGHTADDQVETFLIRFLQGGRSRGLRAISFIQAFENGKVVHPLLELRKADLRKYLVNNNYRWSEDKTNREKIYLRNQIRWELVPLLRKYNPDIENFILEYTSYFRELSDFIEASYPGWEKATTKILSDSEIRWEAEAITNWLPYQQKEFIHMFFLRHFNMTLKTRQVQQIFHFINFSQSGKSLCILENIHLSKEYHSVYIRQGKEKDRSSEPLVITGPGKYSWNGWEVRVKKIRTGDEYENQHVFVPFSQKYHIRSFRAGDRISLSRPRMTKKLKKIFQEHRIPLSQRKDVPLLYSPVHEQILAVFLPERTLISRLLYEIEPEDGWIIRIQPQSSRWRR